MTLFIWLISAAFFFLTGVGFGYSLCAKDTIKKMAASNYWYNRYIEVIQAQDREDQAKRFWRDESP